MTDKVIGGRDLRLACGEYDGGFSVRNVRTGRTVFFLSERDLTIEAHSEGYVEVTVRFVAIEPKATE